MENTPQERKKASGDFKDSELISRSIARLICTLVERFPQLKELESGDQVVDMLVKLMREEGKSDRSIQKTLPALHEIAKYIKLLPGSLATEEPEHPAQTAQSDPQDDKPEPGNQSVSPDTDQNVA